MNSSFVMSRLYFHRKEDSFSCWAGYLSFGGLVFHHRNAAAELSFCDEEAFCSYADKLFEMFTLQDVIQNAETEPYGTCL